MVVPPNMVIIGFDPSPYNSYSKKESIITIVAMIVYNMYNGQTIVRTRVVSV
jgi:hypothetical protein